MFVALDIAKLKTLYGLKLPKHFCSSVNGYHNKQYIKQEYNVYCHYVCLNKNTS